MFFLLPPLGFAIFYLRVHYRRASGKQMNICLPSGGYSSSDVECGYYVFSRHTAFTSRSHYDRC
jgi:hypothetical protein